MGFIFGPFGTDMYIDMRIMFAITYYEKLSLPPSLRTQHIHIHGCIRVFLSRLRIKRGIRHFLTRVLTTYVRTYASKTDRMKCRLYTLLILIRLKCCVRIYAALYYILLTNIEI